jgi:hypothetical protein
MQALRGKRGELLTEIQDLERQAKERRAKLAHIDEAIRLFDPTADPSKMGVRKRYARRGYFKPGDLSRLVADHLREHPGGATAREITQQAMTARGHDTNSPAVVSAIRNMVATVLRAMAKRGLAGRSIAGKENRWTLLNSI